MTLPELQQNPLVQRVIDIFDADRNGEVDFKGYFIDSFISNRTPLFLLYFTMGGGGVVKKLNHRHTYTIFCLCS